MNIPDVWKLVPVEPTEEMRVAAEHEIERSAVLNYGAAPNYEDLWSLLLAAAPTPPAQDNPWQQAVLNECFAIEGCYKESDPAGTLTCLINWHVLNERDHAPSQDDEPFMYAIMGPDGKPHFDEICVSGVKGDLSDAVYYLNEERGDAGQYNGDTPRIAAMRCFVASKYGEEVPDE